MDNYKNYLTQSLEEAVSLPFESYTSDEIYEVEKEKVFFNDWVFVGSAFELENVGDYISLSICGEPIIVAKGKDEVIRAHSNTCRHKGTILVEEGRGNTKNFLCPYHYWSYSLEGELKGAPHTGNVKLDKKAHCLKGFKVEIWCNLVFVNLSSTAEPLAQRYKGMEKYLEAFDHKRFKHPTRGEKEVWQSNWKLAMENAMESYHLFAVHKETLEKTTPTKDAFYLEGGADWTLTGGKIKDAMSGLSKLFSSGHEHLYNYVLFSLPPSFVGILTYENFGWIQVLPNGAGETHVISGGVGPKKGKASKAEREFVEAFFLEDKEICERVHKSMHSKFGAGGKLVELERVVVDFRHYLAKYIYGENKFSHYRSDSEYVLR
jgi:phenylpropionate dioxygenase-like ring-hydroxylating dioxygenase large terminal subunit